MSVRPSLQKYFVVRGLPRRNKIGDDPAGLMFCALLLPLLKNEGSVSGMQLLARTRCTQLKISGSWALTKRSGKSNLSRPFKGQAKIAVH